MVSPSPQPPPKAKAPASSRLVSSRLASKRLSKDGGKSKTPQKSKPSPQPAPLGAAASSSSVALPEAGDGLYAKLRQLGEGSFGLIWLVRRSGDGRELVLKEMALSRLSPKEVAACRLEMEVLKRFDHPSIIPFVSSYEIPGSLGILMEHASGGDLQRLIDQRIAEGNKLLPEWRIKSFALQVGHAVSYIHNYMLLLHRDIKPANVFLSPIGDVRLGDFGMCKLIPCSRINMIPREDARPKPGGGAASRGKSRKSRGSSELMSSRGAPPSERAFDARAESVPSASDDTSAKTVKAIPT